MSHQRYFFIDTARVAMMVLGVLYHAAAFQGVSVSGPVNFDTHHVGFDHFMHSTHLFRMPAFFLLAGFLGALLLERLDPITFLEKRATRLLVPFGAALVLLNATTFSMIAGDASAGAGHRLTLHLWFLPVLMMYALLHVLIAPPHRVARFAPSSRHMPAVLVAFIAIALPAAATFVWNRVVWRIPVPEIEAFIHHTIDVRQLLEYSPAYFTGVLLYQYRDRMDDILKGWPLHLAWTAAYFVSTRGEWPSNPVAEFERYGAAYSATFCILAFFRFAVPADAARPWMSNGAMTLYLLHMPVLIWLKSPIEGMTGGILSRFLLITASTVVICATAHWLIMQSHVAGFIFNGQGARKRSNAEFQTTQPRTAGTLAGVDS